MIRLDAVSCFQTTIHVNTFDAFMKAAEIYFMQKKKFTAELLRFLFSNLLHCNSRHRACDV